MPPGCQWSTEVSKFSEIPCAVRTAGEFDMQRIFAISAVAEHIWQNLDGEKSLDEIRDDIVATFDVEKARADADLQEFIAELLEAGLILEAK